MSVDTPITIPEIISKKRDGNTLTKEEIEFFVKAVVNGDMQDAQVGAMLMAIFLMKLNDQETTNLTRAMVYSGDVLQWPNEMKNCLVDKHSTGGVGDKISLILAPALAACGMKVPMISGRGLEFTGGTLDKLESIPGFSANIDAKRIQEIVSEVGCCIVGQTETLCPADRKLYAFRDVTGTVKDNGLIAASIVSKKAAEHVKALVLDIKCGRGALFKSPEEAMELAEKMVAIGRGLGVNTIAAFTRMDVPIGYMVGNALEIVETVKCLHGEVPRDIMELVTYLGAQVLISCKKVHTVVEAEELIREQIKSGKAMKKFRDMIVAQGVQCETADKLCGKDSDVWLVLPRAQTITEIKCKSEGKVKDIAAMDCALMSGRLGAGRTKSDDQLNYAVGLELCVQIGDLVKEGETWLKIHHDEPVPVDLMEKVDSIIEIVPATENVDKPSRIIKKIPEDK